MFQKQQDLHYCHLQPHMHTACPTHLNVPVDHAHAVAVINNGNDLTHQVGRVPLRVGARAALVDHVPQVAALAELRSEYQAGSGANKCGSCNSK